MALTIKSIPVLTGISALEFDKRADEKALLATPQLTEEQKMLVDMVMAKSKAFKW